MNRRIIYVFIFLIAFLASIVYGLNLLNTKSGTDFTLKTLSALSKHSFTYDKSEGILTDLSLQKLHYQNKLLLLDIDSFKLNWQPSDMLLKGNIHILKAEMIGVNIQFLAKPKELKTSEEKSKKTNPLIMDFQIDEFKSENIKIKTPKHITPFVFDRFDLKLKPIPHAFEINTSLAVPFGKFVLSGEIAKENNLRWQATFSNLHYLNSVLNGSLDADGTFTGNSKKPNITAKINASLLKYKENKLDKLTANLDVNFLNPEQSLINIDAKKLDLGVYKIDQIKLKNDSLTLKLLPLTLAIGSGEQIQKLLINESSLKIIPNKNSLDFFASVNIEKQKPIFAELSIPTQSNKLQNIIKKQELTGSLKWQSTNLKFLNLFFPKLKNPEGSLTIDYKISGKLTEPVFTGLFSLNNFKADLPEIKLKLTNGEIKALNDGKNISYTAKLKSGDGFLEMNGKTAFSTSLPTIFKISGQNVLLCNTQATYIVASPNLEFRFKDSRIDIEGTAIINHARIEPKYYNDVANLPKEIEFVSTEQTSRTKPLLEIYNKINLVLNDTKINIAGLEGDLVGNLKLYDTPTNTTATGDLSIKNGKYTLSSSNQILTVDYGNLHYLNSEITNPNLNISASRTFQSPDDMTTSTNLTVGMHIQGRLDRIKTSLFSSPTKLNDTDILSYIVLGQPSSQIHGNGISMLFNVASALNIAGIGQFSNFTGEVQKALGLSKFGLETESVAKTEKESAREPINLLPDATAPSTGSSLSTTTALVLGKYLSPRLYIGYSFRIIDQVNVFRASLLLDKAKNWKLQSEASTIGKSLDLIYSIERE